MKGQPIRLFPHKNPETLVVGLNLLGPFCNLKFSPPSPNARVRAQPSGCRLPPQNIIQDISPTRLPPVVTGQLANALFRPIQDLTPLLQIVWMIPC